MPERGIADRSLGIPVGIRAAQPDRGYPKKNLTVGGDRPGFLRESQDAGSDQA
jgi:hypothetical protein